MFTYTVFFQSKVDGSKFKLFFTSGLKYHEFKSWLIVTFPPHKARIISIIGKRA